MLKKFNYFLLEHSFILRRLARRAKHLQKTLRRPKDVNLELTNICNSNCLMCPYQYMTREKGYMSFDLIKKVTGELRKYKVPNLQLWHMGECLLHPEFERIIEFLRCHLPEMNIRLATNGEALTREKSIALIKNDVSVGVSLDASTGDQHARIRRKLHFAKIEENMKQFVELRKEMGRKSPSISVHLIEMDVTHDFIEDFMAKWKRVVDGVGRQAYQNWGGHVQDRSIGGHKIRSAIPKYDFPCGTLWKELIITWDGRVALCCLDYDVSYPLGVAQEKSIMEIWKGPGFSEARRLHMNKEYEKIPLCKNCNRFTFYMGSSWERMWKD